jgi:hypothetical protein
MEDEKLGGADSSADRFTTAWILLAVVWIFILFCVFSILAGSKRSGTNDMTRKLAAELNISDLSIVPSGRVPRAIETVSSAVESDFSPFFPGDVMDVKYLIVGSPKTTAKYNSP